MRSTGRTWLRDACGRRGDRDGGTRRPQRSTRSQHGRATGTFVLARRAGRDIDRLLPIAYAVARDCASARALRTLAWAALVVGLIALALTYSRAGWMGFAAAAAFSVRGADPRAVASRQRVDRRRGRRRAAALQRSSRSERRLHPHLDLAGGDCRSSTAFRSPASGRLIFRGSTRSCAFPTGIRPRFTPTVSISRFFAELGILGLAAVAWRLVAFAARAARAHCCRPPKRRCLALQRGGGTGRRCRARADRYDEHRDFRTLDADDGSRAGDGRSQTGRIGTLRDDPLATRCSARRCHGLCGLQSPAAQGDARDRRTFRRLPARPRPR